MANDLTAAQNKLLTDREQWQQQYSHWLKRKNNFATKLQEAGRSTDTSKKYRELDTQVKKYHTLLRESLPEYKSMFKK